MRIILMGTGPFALPSCKRLLADGHDVPLVVTRPLVNPSAKKLPPRPVYDWAQNAGLTIFEPPSINTPDAIGKLKELESDLFFVCDYGQILSHECLEASRLGGINLHGSLLPRHRGAAPVQWCLLRGDTVAGVSVIHMTPRLDAGPMLAIRETDILDDETAEELEPRLAEIGVDATIESLEVLESWDGVREIGKVQDKNLVTKAPRFAKTDGALDFRLPADYLVRLIRACQPWPGTFAELAWPEEKKQLRLIVRRARQLSTPKAMSLQPGEAQRVSVAQMWEKDPEWFEESHWPRIEQWSNKWQEVMAVGCGEGTLLISEVQPAGKRLMNVQEFMRGHQIVPGCQFRLPKSAKTQLDTA
jgi:methionyl-tRNA formyltransferase